jgi:GntR family transcriptional regulator
LERAGLIQTRHGKGSVVAERPQLARDLHERALHAQLAEAAATAALLGLDRAQLQARLDAALDAAADSFPPFPISSDLPEPTP